MEVLGLNGIYDRSHDTSACLIAGGGIAAYVEEERFTRQKKAFDTIPRRSISFCLEEAGIGADDVDAVTHGWLGADRSFGDVLPDEYKGARKSAMEIIQVPHHEAHAASAFYTSSFTESAVLVIDGQGEDESTSIWHATKDGMKKLQSYGVESSLGYTYAAISRFCGFGSFGAGKVMGLAPYGVPRYIDAIGMAYESVSLEGRGDKDAQDAFLKSFLSSLTKLGFHAADNAYSYDASTAKVKQQPILLDVHKDMAASVQAFLEDKMLALAAQAKALTGSDNLCLAGGVAMNCVTNSVIQDSGLFTNLFMQPGCEDSGIALGSALAYSKQKVPLDSPYKGPSFSDAQIHSFLTKNGLNAQECSDVSKRAAELIAKGNIIGWFQGGLEYGPRALGGRSILANPDTTQRRDRVNTVKSREPWRPFGPSVLSNAAPDMFVRSHPSPYMLRSFTVADKWQERLAAVVHVDGSTRPQTVDMDANPRYYRLIKEFAEITGTPAVLNTSFNGAEEPIVASPADAVRTFATTGLDYLVLGSFILSK